MSRLFVGLHAGLVAVIILFGLAFLSSGPCLEGPCPGAMLGLGALGVATLGGAGVVIWWAGHRAAPLLILDSVLAAFAGYSLLDISPYAPGLAVLGVLLVGALSLPGAVIAGRAVATNRIERLLAVAALVGLAVLFGGGGVVVLVLGLLALGTGWLPPRPGAAPR